ncbi:MAG: hypothetical protein IKH90_04550, partial [Ruminococcus sp.]|nr:hypothetical protein [Ruminococcus sp.]
SHLTFWLFKRSFCHAKKLKQSQSKKLQFTLDFALPVIDRIPAVFGLLFAPLKLTFLSSLSLAEERKYHRHTLTPAA